MLLQPKSRCIFHSSKVCLPNIAPFLQSSIQTLWPTQVWGWTSLTSREIPYDVLGSPNIEHSKKSNFKKSGCRQDVWVLRFFGFCNQTLGIEQHAHLGTFAFCDGTAQDQQMPTFSSLLTMWIINKYYVKLTESFSLSKLFKLFQILDALRVDYMSNMQKLPWSQECCTKRSLPEPMHIYRIYHQKTNPFTL